MATRRAVDHPLLDEVSCGIINALQDDGRRPYASIGRTVGLSEAAVRQRVQRLLDAGVIQIVAVTNPLQAGYRRQAMIGVRVDGDLDDVVEALAALPEVTEVVVTAGSFDLLVEAVCHDDAELLDLITARIRSLSGVRSTESFVYLQVRKHQASWRCS